MFKKLNYQFFFFSFIFHILEILSFSGENYKNVSSIHYSPGIYAEGYQSSWKLVRLYRTFGLFLPDHDTWLIIENMWQLHDKRIKMSD